MADFAYPRKGKEVVKNLRKAIQDEQSLARGTEGAREGGREAADESWATSAVVCMSPEILARTEGIQDQEQWAQNVEGTCEGFQNRDQCLKLQVRPIYVCTNKSVCVCDVLRILSFLSCLGYFFFTNTVPPPIPIRSRHVSDAPLLLSTALHHHVCPPGAISEKDLFLKTEKCNNK